MVVWSRYIALHGYGGTGDARVKRAQPRVLASRCMPSDFIFRQRLRCAGRTETRWPSLAIAAVCLRTQVRCAITRLAHCTRCHRRQGHNPAA
ncbi:hypothetical protein XAP412_390002 [Xanthomonas phaseoli pv. phaseoli]|nr:hypothetical protein XAP412_390002 [Xanthomonas phaseoli pv. phaseoli]